MKNIFKLTATLSLIALGFGFNLLENASAQDLSKMKIGSVNMQEALNESVSGIQSKAQIELKVKNKAAEFKSTENKLVNMRGEIDNSLINEDARKDKIKELEKMQATYLKDRQDFEAEIRESEGELTAAIFKDLKDVISDIAKKQKYDMIIEYSLYTAMLYHNLNIKNITKEVIEAYDLAYTSKSKK